ncbi:MAG: hypothetical protein IT225_08705 [Flavobacteriales bacterium]|jgi:purine-cytosine permease-like protein|nr:hypothetical protein [Flavobacteriales bacterium]
MDRLKRYAGIVWMGLGPLALIALSRTAWAEIGRDPSMDRLIQWGVFVAVAIPIAAGLMIFGYYAFNGAYDRSNEDDPHA